MTIHTTRHSHFAPADPARSPSPRTGSAPADLAPALPPAFEAFCALTRDSYLDYARAHLPPQQAHSLVCGVLGELAVGWCDIVSSPNPPARAWTRLRTRVRTTAPAPDALVSCSAQQYDALVLHCLLAYSSEAAATVMGLDASKVRYLVLSATPARRQAVRHLASRPAVFRAA